MKVGYAFSDELVLAADRLPSNVGRSSLVHGLVAAYGLLEAPNIVVLPVTAASRSELLAYHGKDYVDRILEVGKQKDQDHLELSDDADGNIATIFDYGLAHDCPPFQGLPDYVSLVAGSSLACARALNLGTVDAAISWDGGRVNAPVHHCRKNTAAGFCYVNDLVLSILELKRKHARILYVDLDLHHGDGVETAFSHSASVFTLSLHRKDLGFYPGTGSEVDLGLVPSGKGRGTGYAMNVPLGRGLCDANFERLVRGIVLKAIEAFQPGAIVCQCGVDGLFNDPCQEWNLSAEGFADCIKLIQFAATQQGIKTLYTGGGGYNSTAAAKAYAVITGALLEVELAGEIPEHRLWVLHSPNFELHQIPADRADENDTTIPVLIASVNSRLSKIGSTYHSN